MSRLGNGFAVIFVFAVAAHLRAQAPLHQRIDQAIAAATPDYSKKAAALAADMRSAASEQSATIERR